MRVTVLTAVYNDWPSVAALIPHIDKIFQEREVSATFVIVDDGSSNGQGRKEMDGLDLKAIEEVLIVDLASNQGNQRALAIGVGYIANNVTGDYLVVIDADHEDNPEDILKLLSACIADGGQRIFFAARGLRSEGTIFRLLYRLYRYVFRVGTGHSMFMGNFCIIPTNLVKRLAYLSNLWNHFPAAIMRARLPYEHMLSDRKKRMFGQSKMNMERLVVHAFSAFYVFLDVLAVRVLFCTLGVGVVFAGLFFWLILQRILTDIALLGWTSTIILLLIIVLLQVASSSIIILFAALSKSIQLPLIPFHDYGRFVYRVVNVFRKKTKTTPIKKR